MSPPTISRGHELRRHPRTPVSGTVTVGWTDAGGVNRVTRGRCTNASQSGLCIELRDPLPDRAYVNFRCESLKLAGTGSVRHCSRRSLCWTIGLEFSGGLAWKS